MQAIAGELEALIKLHKAALLSVPEEKMAFKTSLLKWSRKDCRPSGRFCSEQYPSLYHGTI